MFPRIKLLEIIKRLESENADLNHEYRKQEDLYEIEKNLHNDNKAELEDLKTKIHGLIALLKDLRNLKNIHSVQSEKVFNNLFKFYKD